MDDNKEMGWGWLILIFLFFIVFGNDGFFGGGNAVAGDCRCSGISNCEVEKQEIIDSARTQYLIEDKANNTNALILAEEATTRARMDYYALESLKDQLFLERTKNVQLENRIYSDQQFNALQSEIQHLSCELPKRPPVYAQAGIPTVYPYPPYGACGNV